MAKIVILSYFEFQKPSTSRLFTKLNTHDIQWNYIPAEYYGTTIAHNYWLKYGVQNYYQPYLIPSEQMCFGDCYDEIYE